jgi:hypothetical protein
MPSSSKKRETILAEAERVVYSERAKSYGNPEDNFERIANYWNAYLGEDSLVAHDVAMMLILMKVGRLTTGEYKRDSAVDIAGYAECLSRINEVRR